MTTITHDWPHETDVWVGWRCYTVGWNATGEDYEGSLYEPPSYIELNFEVLDPPESSLSERERDKVQRALLKELHATKNWP